MGSYWNCSKFGLRGLSGTWGNVRKQYLQSFGKCRAWANLRTHLVPTATQFVKRTPWPTFFQFPTAQPNYFSNLLPVSHWKYLKSRCGAHEANSDFTGGTRKKIPTDKRWDYILLNTYFTVLGVGGITLCRGMKVRRWAFWRCKPHVRYGRSNTGGSGGIGSHITLLHKVSVHRFSLYFKSNPRPTD